MGFDGFPVYLSVAAGILIIVLIPLVTTASPLPISPSVNEDSNHSTPCYIITRIALPLENIPVSPGNPISLNCWVQNTGANDTGTSQVHISASLGSYPLTSITGMVPPLKSGQEHHETFTYIIPEGVPPRMYPLKIFIQNEKAQSVNAGTRTEMKGPDILVVRKTETGVKRSGCGCT